MPYRMPAEWEPHRGTWLAWPHNKEHWPGKFEPIPKVFAEITDALCAGGDEVFICVNNETAEREARNLIGTHKPGVTFYHIPTNASWSRDHGPIFVRDEKDRLTITDWVYNAWGGKYPPWEDDDIVPKKISTLFDLPCVEPGIVLEGGSIDVNGRGTLLTTEQCLLNKNRNPQLNREQIEQRLAHYLGANNILWLREGIVGDDTDGHIDDIARFVNPTTIVAAIEENRDDENFKILNNNFDSLHTMKDQDGKPLTIIPLPMPAPVLYAGERLPASYANFYIANAAILLPTFNCDADREAERVLAKVFPGRTVIPIHCTDLVWGLGTIHCSTQQHPT